MEWAAYVCQNLICQAPVTTCSAAPMKAFGTLFLTVALASCRIAPPHSTPASLESTPQWFEQQLKDQADRIKAYQEQYAHIKCEADTVPKFVHYRVPDVFLREQHLNHNLRLALKLGKAREIQERTERHFRTDSRYQLKTGTHVLCDVESVLSDDMPPDQPSGRISWHEDSEILLIEEEHDWSTTREIVMFSTSHDGKKKWEARVIGVPRRVGGPGTTRGEGDLLGAANGKVYIKVDGFVYAFPIAELEEDKFLGFLPG